MYWGKEIVRLCIKKYRNCPSPCWCLSLYVLNVFSQVRLRFCSPSRVHTTYIIILISLFYLELLTFWHFSFALPCRLSRKQICVLLLEKYQLKYLHRWHLYTTNSNQHRISPRVKTTLKYRSKVPFDALRKWCEFCCPGNLCHGDIAPVHQIVPRRVKGSDWYISVNMEEGETFLNNPSWKNSAPPLDEFRQSGKCPLGNTYVVHTLPKGFTA